MSIETLQRPLETEIGQKHQHVFFVAGARGTYDGVKSIQGELSDEFGPEKVSVYNSILSKDAASPTRHEDMGRAMKAQIERGKTTIAAHSFGAAEVVAAFDAIEKEDPNFFKKKENINNINLVLISPAGLFENWWQGVKYLAKYGRLGIQEAAIMRRTLPGKTSILNGVASASAIPSRVLQRESFADRIRKIGSKISQADGTVREYHTYADRDYDMVMDARTRELMDASDKKFYEKTNGEELTWMQRMAAKKALRQRARITRKVFNKAVNNEYSNEPAIPHKQYDKSMSMVAKKAGMLKDTFLKGHVMERMTELQNAGVKINIVIPEQDTQMSVAEAQKFLGKHKDRLVVSRLATHSMPWAPQPKSVLSAIRAFDTVA